MNSDEIRNFEFRSKEDVMNFVRNGALLSDMMPNPTVRACYRMMILEMLTIIRTYYDRMPELALRRAGECADDWYDIIRRNPWDYVGDRGRDALNTAYMSRLIDTDTWEQRRFNLDQAEAKWSMYEALMPVPRKNYEEDELYV